MKLPEEEKMRDEHNESEGEYGKIDTPKPQGQGAHEEGKAETGQATGADNENQG